MKISNIIIENYRSIQKLEIKPNKFSIFVGKNNHGKTNLFEAINWFYSSRPSKLEEQYFNKDSNNIISVEISFDNISDHDLERLSTTSKNKVRNLLSEHRRFSIKKTSEGEKTLFINGKEEELKGVDKALSELLPKLEYINSNKTLDEVGEYKVKTPIGIMLSVLNEIVEDSEEYKLFKESFSKLFDEQCNGQNSEVRQKLNELSREVETHIKRQFPNGTTVEFDIKLPEFKDLLKKFGISINDGIQTKAESKGDGMQRALVLSILQTYAKYRKEENSRINFLFLIDEAELHLHPSAQRALKEALFEISNTDQVFINTHSSVLITGSNSDQKLFKVEKIDKITYIQEVGETDKINIIFDLLGGSPSDLLLPENFLIVEGKSEYEFITKVINRFYKNEFKGIKVIPAHGDKPKQMKTYEAINKILSVITEPKEPAYAINIYKDRVVVLMDKPNQTQLANFKTLKPLKKEQVFELPVESLEKYYPKEYQRNVEEVEKTKYAKEVAEKITQQDFESNMKEIWKALQTCKSKGFNSFKQDNAA